MISKKRRALMLSVAVLAGGALSREALAAGKGITGKRRRSDDASATSMLKQATQFADRSKGATLRSGSTGGAGRETPDETETVNPWATGLKSRR
jgi:hypothetical protein